MCLPLTQSYLTSICEDLAGPRWATRNGHGPHRGTSEGHKGRSNCRVCAITGQGGKSEQRNAAEIFTYSLNVSHCIWPQFSVGYFTAMTQKMGGAHQRGKLGNTELGHCEKRSGQTRATCVGLIGNATRGHMAGWKMRPKYL